MCLSGCWSVLDCQTLIKQIIVSSKTILTSSNLYLWELQFKKKKKKKKKKKTVTGFGSNLSQVRVIYPAGGVFVCCLVGFPFDLAILRQAV